VLELGLLINNFETIRSIFASYSPASFRAVLLSRTFNCRMNWRDVKIAKTWFPFAPSNVDKHWCLRESKPLLLICNNIIITRTLRPLQSFLQNSDRSKLWYYVISLSMIVQYVDLFLIKSFFYCKIVMFCNIL